MRRDMGIAEVIIHVGDVDAAVTFYTKVCRMRFVRALEESGSAVAELDADGQRVTLVESKTAGVQLALETGDARAEHRRMKRRQVTSHGDPTEVDGGLWVGFEDPWGNRLGYWQHQD